MNDNASALAEELRAICEEWERDIKACLLWADARAANQHHKRLAALVVRRVLIQGFLPTLTSIDSVASVDGYLNWHLLRHTIGLAGVVWLQDFDIDNAPPNRKRWIQTPDLASDDDDDDDEADAWKHAGEPWKPLAGTVYEDKTADQLRVWYVEQSKAWQSTIATAATQIEAYRKWQPWPQELVDNAKGKQRRLLEMMNANDGVVGIDDFASEVGWEKPVDDNTSSIITAINKRLKTISRQIHRHDNAFKEKTV